MKIISPLEKEIMDLVWGGGGTTVGQIHKGISNQKLAYTTVATILQRLYNKGLLERKREGRAHVYLAKVSKKSYSKQLIKGFLNKLFNSYGDAAVVSFAESIEKLPEEKKRYLLKLLNK